jgi:hypothetical protein
VPRRAEETRKPAGKPPREGRDTAFPNIRSPPKAGHAPIRERFSNRLLDERNADPKPFTWTATPASILARLNHVNASVH